MSYSYLYLLSICIQILQLSSLKKYKITSNEHKEISRLKISSVKKKQTQDQRRPVEAGQEFSDGIVFLEFQV